MNILYIIYLAIGTVAGIIGIIAFFISRKSAKVVYEFVELADFNLPASFYKEINEIPFRLYLENIGNKSAKNILIKIKTKNDIAFFNVKTDEKYVIEQENQKCKLVRLDNLNPNENIDCLGRCKKGRDPTKSIQKELKITIEEGSVFSKEQNSFKSFYIDGIDSILGETISGRILRLFYRKK